MTNALHCDKDGCDTWEKEPEDEDSPHGSWFVLTTSDSFKEWHFCSKDCLMFWSANAPAVS